jgi:hypothetical protein
MFSRQRIQRKNRGNAGKGLFYAALAKGFQWDKFRIQRFVRESVSRVEAGSNTSTVALRVVGGHENGTQCLGV